MFRKILYTLMTIIVALIAAILIRTMLFNSIQTPVEATTNLSINAEAAAVNLAKALTFKTIAMQSREDMDMAPFVAFREFLESTYPRVHTNLSREIVGGHGLLYHWEGSNTALKPIILLAHFDVVPVSEATIDSWTYPPFAGTVADGMIWGRGAMDDKGSLISIMEAVERLLVLGYRPDRSIYLSFGHDEEIGGAEGAASSAVLLEERGIEAEFVLDEGMVIIDGNILGVDSPIALVGVAEKGYLTLELVVEAQGGHSSMPPPNSGLGILSKAVTRLEENQLPASIDGVVGDLFNTVGREMPFVRKAIFANMWLFKPIVLNQLTSSHISNAMVRTTTAVTMAKGSPKENVLPIRSSMVVNFRIMPGETPESVIEHVRTVIDDDRVQIIPGMGNGASSISSTDTDAYRTIEKSIRQTFSNMIVAPSLMVAATDTRHFHNISKNIYRFAPSNTVEVGISGIHGTNERMAVKNLGTAIAFYMQLLQNGATVAEEIN